MGTGSSNHKRATVEYWAEMKKEKEERAKIAAAKKPPKPKQIPKTINIENMIRKAPFDNYNSRIWSRLHTMNKKTWLPILRKVMDDTNQKEFLIRFEESKKEWLCCECKVNSIIKTDS